MPDQAILIFQSAKLGEIPKILDEIEWARDLLIEGISPNHIYGSSGGALVAVAFALARAARDHPEGWDQAFDCLLELKTFLQKSKSYDIRSFNLNPLFGPYNLAPLRRWFTLLLAKYHIQKDILLSRLPVKLYLCAMDKDGILTLFGPPDQTLQMAYHFVHIGPPQDAPLIDALTASLSTLLSTEPWQVNGPWYRDNRPAYADLGAIISDLEQVPPKKILRRKPYTPLREWKLNFISGSFIMHSYLERNQALLSAYYMDLRQRQIELQQSHPLEPQLNAKINNPQIRHVQLPYVGSTEASTNMRDSVAHKDELMQKFERLLEGQLDGYPFDRPTNIIYGAGGFSGILAGLVTTRAVDAGFKQYGDHIEQIYGVSAGVLNGFFHAVQLAAHRYPDVYKPAARNALADLENLISTIKVSKVVSLNWNPARFWQGFANLKPFKEFIRERLEAYTGSKYVDQITFDDIGLPMTISVGRVDGFPDFLGMSVTGRQMLFAGRKKSVLPAPIIKAVVAGWSMCTYIEPVTLNGVTYQDGGGVFYDIGLFVACMDPKLKNMINIHLDEAEDHSYHIPPRPNLVRIVFDTHNYTFPEERRRMFYLTNLLYEHYRLREQILNTEQSDLHANLPDDLHDFRQDWDPEDRYYGEFY
jgi:predicted acylesterase/phospholipase RssA